VGVPRVRLRALAESPGSFTATLAEEADRDEQFWRGRMTRSHRLLAERGPVPQGIVSLGPYEQEASAAESSACSSSQSRGGPASLGASSRLRRIWRRGRATCSSTTGCGPTMDERLASPTTSGFAPPTTAAQHTPPTLTQARKLPWCCRWSPTRHTLAPNPTSGKPASREGPLS
jgi:hypothetical protein